MAVERRALTTRMRIGWVLGGFGILLFPLLWLAIVIGHAAEYARLMQFFARTDAHLLFDLPGSLRAYKILFAVLPAAGAGLVASGILLTRGRSVSRVALAGAGVGAIVLVLAVAVTPLLTA